MNDIFLRAYTDHILKNKGKFEENHNANIKLILDIETTVDQYQNLLFGSCLVMIEVSSGIKYEWYIFYGNISENDKRIIEEFTKGNTMVIPNNTGNTTNNTKNVIRCNTSNTITVLPVREFIDNIFYQYAYKMRAEVIGFNLPFDLSRLAIEYGISRKAEDGFSFKLSEDVRNPRIRIQSIDQKRSFISFAKPLRKKSDRKYKHYSGYFVDLKTLTFALTDKPHSLDSACKDFGVSRKQHTEEHGKITKEYIEYNLNDTKITAELYQACLKRYEMFSLPDSVNRLYSPASIGKAYLRKMGIKSFMELNTDFTKEILGFVMSAYFGGRTEVRIKDKSISITYLDFTSMYPSVYSLLGLDRFLKTKKIGFKHSTERIEQFLKSLRIEALRNPEIWKKEEMHSIVLIKPNEDILPIRAEYSKEAKNIGINSLTSSKQLWYSIEDVIASKLLTGKIPEIVDAITFYPEGIQEGLREVDISGITIKSDEDFIRRIIEERIKIKKSDNPEREQIQLILKIIANATSYGIYIEENQESLKDADNITIYSLDNFPITSIKTERQGEYFNPIIAVLLTSSARLILSIAEKIAVSKGYFAYCDTDSVFVDPKVVKEIQDFFRPLNPYSENVEMFKIEMDDYGNPLDNVMFYGISAKRYCLYRIDNGEIDILKYSTHGLGHLKDINGKEIWKDILNKDFEKYSEMVAVSQITITKPSILNRFKTLNKDKPIKKRIKPFNFILVGSEVYGVIPCLPYKKDINGIQYDKFIDYRTGKTSDDLPLPRDKYWKSLQDVLNKYIRHNDNKFEYVNGIAHRKHIIADRIRYIGKESNNLDEVSVLGIDEDSYLEYEDLKEFHDWILLLKPKDVRDIGISERELKRKKAEIRKGKRLNFNTKVNRILLSHYKSRPITG